MYFSGTYHYSAADGTRLDDAFLCYLHSGPESLMAPVARSATEADLPAQYRATTQIEHRTSSGQTLVTIISGRPTGENLSNLRKLAMREPATQPPTPPCATGRPDWNLPALGIRRMDVLAGSGLSYEAGLPMLKEVHDLFWVDDGYEGFRLGGTDQLPALVSRDIESAFRTFSSWHTTAARTAPSLAHQRLLGLRRVGVIDRVFTDNVDNLFPDVGITDAERVRGCGVVNEVYPATFGGQSAALLVIGVSADRRGIIEQARAAGMRIVVVNPYMPVSPGARNLDYLHVNDIYFPVTADEALSTMVATFDVADISQILAGE